MSKMSLLERTEPALLPDIFTRWFSSRGWAPRAHQLELLARGAAGRSVLLIAPTGGGKTLAGFLPTLVELSEGRSFRSSSPRAPTRSRSPVVGEAKLPDGGGSLRRSRSHLPVPDRSAARTSPHTGGGRKGHRNRGLHTLYISPLKALAVDIARNLEIPVAEMGLPIRLETRTGDTPASKRQRQRRDPPDILLTTPEQLALLLACADAPYLFAHAAPRRARRIAFAGHLQARRSALARTRAAVSPGAAGHQRRPVRHRRRSRRSRAASCCRSRPAGRRAPTWSSRTPAPPRIVAMLDTAEHVPWAGHSARHALGEIYAAIKRHKTTLVFVNTRSQAEIYFPGAVARATTTTLPSRSHHGSLDVGQRRKVEEAMAPGGCARWCAPRRSISASTGAMSIWSSMSARPRARSRLLQRIGRANHRLDEPSQAVLVPANRFEVLECRAALDAVAENAQDTPPLRTGALDVLAQHILGCACGAPFLADELYAEVRAAAPYADLTRADFDAVVDFVATGGYALKAYERFAKIRQDKDGRWRVTHPRVAQQATG